MLASAATQLFISSCAVAIHPAARADKSAISHRRRREGGRPWQQPLHTVNRFTLFVLNAHRQGCRAAAEESTFSDEGGENYPASIWVSYIIYLVLYIYLVEGIYTLVWDQTFLKKCTPFHLFFRLFLSKHQIKATWWKKRKEIPQRTKSNLPEHERENRGSSGSCLDVPNRRMRRQFAQTAFISNLSMCFFKFVFTYNIQKRLRNKQRMLKN